MKQWLVLFLNVVKEDNDVNNYFTIIGTNRSFFGLGLGSWYLAILIAAFGMFNPALFVVERLYKSKNWKPNINLLPALDYLKSNGILTDIEYNNAYSELNKKNEVSENKIRYDEGVDALYELAQANVISDDEFRKKIRLLKSLYKQE